MSEKKVCRLCYYETADTVDIFSVKGVEFDYEAKITKYLYLSVRILPLIRQLEIFNIKI